MKQAKSILASTFALALWAASGAAAGDTQPGGARQAQLRQMLRQNCTVCHGRALQGDAGPALTPQSLAGKNEQLLIATILDGRDGTAMPAWGALIKESEARWLLQLLRSGKPP